MDKSLVKIEHLYDSYYLDVYHFALYYTNSREEAEDITQETFFKVMKQLDNLRDMDKVKTWILSIARNTAVDIHRREKVKRLLIEKLSWQPVLKEVSKPLEFIEKNEQWQIVQEALMTLKSHDRTIIICRMLKDYTIQETAEILGISEVKVRVDFHRAMTRLRKKVGRDD
ncbi:RNA polymerase sigma factor [Lysinibacillus pakistanensis]|uniref:RNA polymerase sigma factor n=1 Tax=Lysinibacillus pakistanensis TaxID=759811 RepID=A0AAX3WU24_9BACI|nr:RNA polymerase sigma factor [Lysinibacillus pakistanensis]MDM5230577.1 RNA polymerase sigma factor [Lysinibacillus pakistanensis]WHY46154.1 RNA polymerase sigma factor [Lysinibacillus pakistanensis]WHY51165.1 RNA polymerase sigma factor [Lysinibacillus pakistanensis]